MEIQAKKITLGQLPTLAGIVRAFPQVLGNLEALDNATIVEKLPQIIEVALPEVAKIVAMTTNLKEEDVETLDLAEFTEIVAQVLEVNRFEEVVKNLKVISHRVRGK